MRLLKATALAASVLFGTLGLARADALSDFYKGKTVTLYVGYSAGGGYDLYARLFARHFGDHMPGHPTVIVSNMPGAGSLKLTNYLAKVAPKDGTALGAVSRGIPVEPLFDPGSAQFDAKTMTWIGSLTDEVSVCASWHTSDIKTWEDVFDPKKDLVIGGTGATSDVEVFTRMLKDMFDAHLKLISGYPGSSDLSLAIERGEIEGRCGWSLSSITGPHPDWMKNNMLNFLVQLSTRKSPELPNVPLIFDYAKTDEQKQVLRLILSRLDLARPFVAPPNLPADRAAALRQAFMETAQDPAFLDEAKTAGFEIDPTSGEDMAKMIAEIYQTPPDVVARAKTILGSGGE